MKKKELYTIPNLLSFYRLLAFPLLLYFLFSEKENLFVIFLITNLITDILDGLIARTFNMQTELGARIDSIADTGTYICAILGIFWFKSEEFSSHWISFGVFIGLFIFANLLALIKFGRMPSLHLYSWKLGGYIQGTFFFVLFLFDFFIWFYYFMITWGILAFSEHIIIQLIIPEIKSNAKTLYHVLKNRKYKQ